MKNIPDKIWLVTGLSNTDEEVKDFKELSEVTWSEEKIFDRDIPFERTINNHDLWHTVADEDWPNSDKDYLCYNGIDVHIGWFDTNKKVFYNPYSRYKERMLDVECWAEIPELPKRCVPK